MTPSNTRIHWIEAVIAGAAGAAVLAILLHVLGRPRDLSGQPMREAPEERTHDARAMAVAEAPRAAVESAPLTGVSRATASTDLVHVLRVVDEEGNPIPTGKALRSRRRDANAGQRQGTLVAEANEGGEIRLAVGCLATDEVVLVAADGYLTRKLDELPEPGEPTSVVLVRPGTVLFRCEDTSGRPLPGVELLIEKGVGRPPGWSRAPGAPDPKRAVSGLDGCATVTGFEEGTYSYRARKEGYALLEIDPTFDAMVGEVRARFGTMLAIVGVAEGDAVLSWRVTHGGGIPVGSLSAMEEAGRVQRKLSERFPGAFITVACTDGRLPRTVEASILFESGRFGRARLEYRPLTESPLEQRIELETIDGQVPMRRVRIRSEDPLGHAVPIEQLWVTLRLTKERAGDFGVHLEPRGKDWHLLPVGTHSIVKMFPASMGDSVPRVIEVVESGPGEAHLRWPSCVARVRLKLDGEDGEPIPAAQLTVKGAHGPAFVPNVGTVGFVLPLGPFEIRCAQVGYADGVVKGAIDRCSPVEPVEFACTLSKR